MNEFVKVASTSDLSDGEMMAVDVGDARILIANVGGSYYALDEVCTHAEGPLSEGFIEGVEVECPWHGSRFDLATGKVTNPPATESLTRYTVRVEGDAIFVGPA
ncbi:MAG: non-heme iron oxygenase ferredoxin subunit [Chloroflexi bacterium]|nr:non-heme iron oxygenase ferredoxin subunit [Chloroflexota bacterium]